MTKIKILLDKNETPEEAEEILYKALNAQRNGDIHTEDFSDPAMVDVVSVMEKFHKDIYVDMMREIQEVLDREYNGNI